MKWRLVSDKEPPEDEKTYAFKYDDGEIQAASYSKSMGRWIDQECQTVYIEYLLWLDESTEPNQEEELWNECYDKLDELAREVDSYDFGLPMFGESRKSVLDPIKALYTLSRK